MKAIALASVFERYTNNTALVLDIVKKRNLSFLLPQTLKYLKKKIIFNEIQNQISVETPFELSSEAQKHIENRVGLQIEKVKINKGLIAGFKVYTKDKILDASLDTLLKQIIK